MAVSQIEAIKDAGRRAAIAASQGDNGRAAMWHKWASDAAKLEDVYTVAMSAYRDAYKAESASYDVPRGVSGSGRW
jgi:hypothetical protein